MTLQEVYPSREGHQHFASVVVSAIDRNVDVEGVLLVEARRGYIADEYDLDTFERMVRLALSVRPDPL